MRMKTVTTRALTDKQDRYLRNRLQGKPRVQSAIDAGYPDNKNTSRVAYQLEHNKVIKDALNKAGITAQSIAEDLNTHIKEGLHVKNTADTSLRAIQLVSEIYGYTNLKQDKDITNNTQINNYYHSLDSNSLYEELKAIQDSISKLKE